MSYIPGISALSIFKPSDGTTYQLDGSDIAPDSEGYLLQGNFVGSTKGGERTKNKTGTFTVRHADSTFHDNLTSDTDFDSRSFQLVVAYFDSALLWQETQRVSVEIEKAEIDPESDDPFNYTLRFRVISQSPDLYQYRNLINAGEDAFTDFNNGGKKEYIFIFPIEGVTISASADYADNAGSTTQIEVAFDDYSGSEVSNSVTTGVENGNFEITGTAPANTYKVRITYDNLSRFSDGDITNRTIRIGTNSAYTTD